MEGNNLNKKDKKREGRFPKGQTINDLKCKCGRQIEITVPMFENEGNFICKECFENIKSIAGLITTSENYIDKLQDVIERNQSKRRINDQLDLLIDDCIDLLGELRKTKTPLSKEKRDYYFKKLEVRQEKIYEISTQMKP